SHDKAPARASECGRLGSAPGTPDAHRRIPVPPSAGDLLTVGAEGDGVDPVAVALEGEQLLPHAGVPHAHGSIAAPADEALAVGTEGDVQGLAGVPRQAKPLLPGLGAPDPDGPVAAGAGDPLAVGTEGDPVTVVQPSRQRG